MTRFQTWKPTVDPLAGFTPVNDWPELVRDRWPPGTQAEAPYDVLRYGDPAAQGILGAPMECLWETAWQDIGKGYVKRDFVLRFTADADDDDVPVEVTVITERGERSRVCLLAKERRDYRVRIRNAGQRVKLRIRSNGRAAGWRIYGGVQMDYGIDRE